VPSHQALAFKGKGWAAHSFRRWIAAPSSISKRRVAVAGAMGSTLSDTSRITPRLPIEPASNRETS
jgi:hypothetical protein